MSLASQVGTAAATLAAVGAAVSLWWGAEHHTGPVRRAYRWFAFAAALWGAGAVVGQALPAPAGAAAVPLTFGDLPALLALLVMAAGLVRLAAARWRAATGPLPPRQVSGGGRVAARLADGYVLASALFLICWVIVFRSVFMRSGAGPGTFTVELVHPLADLALLGAGLPLAAAAGRRGALPYLCVLVIALGDALAVGARTVGQPPGLLALLVLAAGLVLLACAPWSGGMWPASARLRDKVLASGREAGAAGRRDASGPGGRDTGTPGGPSPAVPTIATIAAAACAAVAAVVLILWALAGESVDRPVVAIVAGTTVLVLSLRALGLVRRESSAAWIWRESRQQLRELADRTSDVVLLCDLGGVIRYASRAVSGYGYTPDGLQGTPLADLLHPEDRAGGTRAVRRAVTDVADRVGRYPCRVRAADGTWRHVESTVSRHREPCGPIQLLVTARDMSAQVALRRQVTHLTFHDGLTGLPNRAYVEQRAREAAVAGGPPLPGETPPAHPVIAGVVLLDLDRFTAVNAAAGHSAGDLLLAQVGRRLRAAVPPQDTVARWGGDEFAVLIEGAVSAEEVVDIAERLARGVASPAFRAGDHDVSLTASVGVALAGAGPVGHIWRKADVAMSRAKERGGGQVEILGADDTAGPGTPAGAGDGAGAAGGGTGPAGVSGQPQAVR